MSKTVLRTYEPTDFEQVVELCQVSLPHEGVTRKKFVLQVLNDPNFCTDGTWVAVSGQQIVGFLHSVHRTCPVDGSDVLDADTGYIVLLAVDETCRRQGVGSSLLSKAEEHLRSCGISKILVGPYSPFYFAPGVDKTYASAIAFFSALGYSPTAEPLSMKTSLRPVTTPEWVEDLTLLERDILVMAWNPELTIPLLEFSRNIFGPDWSRFVRDTIRDIAGGADAQRLLSAVKVKPGPHQVVGFSHYNGERFGPIGVDPEYRGMGIGQELCRNTLLAQRDAGYRESYFLWSNDETAERLYNGFGFEEWRRFVLFKKEL